MITGKGAESEKPYTKQKLEKKGKYSTIVNFLTKVFDFARSDKMRGS